MSTPTTKENPNTSLADKSLINTPDQDRELVKQLAEVMGYRQQQEDIDALKKMIGMLGQQIQNINDSLLKIVPVIDAHTKILNGQASIPQSTGMMDETKLTALASVVEKLAEAWGKIKSANPNPNPAIISQDYINEQVANAVKKKFELGDLIYEAIESTLTKGVSKKVVNAAINHAPE